LPSCQLLYQALAFYLLQGKPHPALVAPVEKRIHFVGNFLPGPGDDDFVDWSLKVAVVIKAGYFLTWRIQPMVGGIKPQARRYTGSSRFCHAGRVGERRAAVNPW